MSLAERAADVPAYPLPLLRCSRHRFLVFTRRALPGDTLFLRLFLQHIRCSTLWTGLRYWTLPGRKRAVRIVCTAVKGPPSTRAPLHDLAVTGGLGTVHLNAGKSGFVVLHAGKTRTGEKFAVASALEGHGSAAGFARDI